MRIARHCRTSAASLAVVLALAGAAMAQKKPLGAGNPDSANTKLENTVKEKLADDARLRDAALTVSADVTRNAVTLGGTVASDALRRRAVELAREAQVGVVVHDRIRIAGEKSG